MGQLIDTDIAIHLRDAQPDVRARFDGLSAPPSLSIISVVELWGGAAADTATARLRRERLAVLMCAMKVVEFDMAVVRSYAEIVRSAGFSRQKVLDRLIAATAIVHDLSLLTINGSHFRDIPGLKLEVWPAPPQ